MIRKKEDTGNWHRAYIALGSNLGEKENYLDMAVASLKERRDTVVQKVSYWIETEPYGYTEQPRFLNGCMEIQTTLGPLALLDVLQAIEARAGRERIIHWGPRTLDLDLLFYEDQIWHTERLTLPHPEIEKRSFVLEPMAQIAPKLRHPVLQKTMEELLCRLKETTEKEGEVHA